MRQALRRIPFPARLRLSPQSSRRGCALQRCKMSSSSSSRTYADAIDALNTLQTPFAVIEARRKAGIKPDESSITEIKAYWARLGHEPENLDRLNVIHVAGTKGKGSVCAFVASILAQHQRARGLPRKIGLLTSPHLIAVRERIRLDGQPLSEDLFARYFFEVYDALSSSSSPAADGPPGQQPDEQQQQQPAPGSKPIYARYLTLLAFHVFLREGVDAAVVETGVGGEYDATNMVARPLAAGISTLGIDHVLVLGATPDEIAWHKAGILKPGRPGFAVEQVAFPSTEAVLRARAAERGVAGGALRIVRGDDDPRLRGVRVRPDAAFQRRNASLAVALAEAALEVLDPEGLRASRSGGEGEEEAETAAETAAGRRLPAAFREGLERVVWRGRCEVKEETEETETDAGAATTGLSARVGARVVVRWHIDGAHTTDSLRVAARWFAGECEGRRGRRVLVFNQQGRAEAVDFLEGLHAGSRRGDASSFDRVVFCTNVTYAASGYKRDFVNNQYDPEAIKKLTVQRQFAERWAELDPKAHITVVPSIEEALNQARALKDTLGEGEAVQVLITGSLHLVGGALGILEGADAL